MKKIILFFILFFSGCGLFTPDTPDDPAGPLNTDPFNFVNILDSENEDEFLFAIYDDVIHAKFIYTDEASLSEEFGRSRFLSRLRTIARDSIAIFWSRKDADQKDPSLLITDSDIKLEIRNYEINIVHTPDDDTVDYTGEVIFDLRFVAESKEWEIINWKDKNTKGLQSDKSYFNPDF